MGQGEVESRVGCWICKPNVGDICRNKLLNAGATYPNTRGLTCKFSKDWRYRDKEYLSEFLEAWQITLGHSCYVRSIINNDILRVFSCIGQIMEGASQTDIRPCMNTLPVLTLQPPSKTKLRIGTGGYVFVNHFIADGIVYFITWEGEV
ncbi:hypothetical protein KC19_8G081900 [Ceratodon purpureus]|uniref:Uncharacterized protein n=1 Tax=Ceratodon purpureus TaxID=3225 RepID=A0A8T0GYH0_CERPU|nr:hypothetical protein KC19_8G081900 [Ceratodon purpureus]